MILIEYFSLSMFRSTADGLYVYQPLGRFGPAFRLKAEQRRPRVLFSMVASCVLMFLASWGSRTLETGVAHVWWFLLVCTCLFLIYLLVGIGLPRTERLPPRTKEDSADYRRFLREHAGIRWFTFLPAFVSLSLGHVVAEGFTAGWWSNLFMVLGVFAVLYAIFSRFWIRPHQAQPPT